MKQGTQTRIGELGTSLAEVCQDVLFSDVMMDYSTGMAVLDSCHHLGKEAMALGFTQWALLCDVVRDPGQIEGGQKPA